MFEEDYILRMTRDLTRAILKLVFNKDIDSPTEELLKDLDKSEFAVHLIAMIDAGQINEAENLLFESTEADDTAALKMALLFYSYLNEKSDEFLEENHFSREEVFQGLSDYASENELSEITDLFLH